MGTGFRGAFVISWSQTDIDGLPDAPVTALAEGATWSWRGAALRVDGPAHILQLDQADGKDALRRRAARVVTKLVGAALAHETPPQDDLTDAALAPLRDSNFRVTDGNALYTVTLIDVGADGPPLLMFLNELPPQNTTLWVVQTELMRAQGGRDTQAAGVICFTPGTLLDTPIGPRRIESLREGDLVETRDNGPQEIRWIGQRRMTGARLFAMPHLRPVRLAAGALGSHLPDVDLIVSPGHRLLLSGYAADMLFNTPEVLVAARDLVNDRSVRIDHAAREVTYIHVMLPRHEILVANGIPTESFHPASSGLETLDANDRERLVADCPDLSIDPLRYGDFARRLLNQSEAALLMHAA